MMIPTCRRRAVLVGAAIAALGRLASAPAAAEGDPLPSWRDRATKRAIREFVAAVTAPGGPDHVPVPERVAVFDNDGTLWIEQPLYVQLAFALDRIRALAPADPGWRERQPFKSVLDGDAAATLAGGEKAILELVMASHAGVTTEDFAQIVRDWLATARHPRFLRPHTRLVYQPMLELLVFLRANGFKTFIVSGGGVDFVRPWSEEAYGIPPEQVVGSSIKAAFELREGAPVLVKLPELEFIDDRAGKPVGIHRFIGRRPIAAFGNSDGDLEMLRWTTQGTRSRRLGVIVHHDDAEREYAYDRASPVGRLDKALDAAPEAGWTVVSMRDDWRRIFPEP
jgi:phosphoglycolate phosphatase-like HAD superfamily hydrolase